MKQARDKRLRITILPLGFVILGIGCITWALIGIGAQTGYALNYVKSHYSASAMSSPFLIEAERINPMELGYIDNVATSGYAMEGIAETSVLSSALEESNRILYPVYPAEGDTIGSLTIPALDRKLPIIQGTSVKELQHGVGHFIQSVLPGEKDNCVISGHRDTVFSKLDKLKIGDLLILQTSAGTFTYEVNAMRIVHKDDKTVIVPTDHAVLTMTTCYPFTYIGPAPDRYILTADLVTK